MKKKLSRGSELIVIRNENEIRFLQKQIKSLMKDIDDLRKQNRDIKGRD